MQLADAAEIRDSSKQELESDKAYFNTFVHDCLAKAVHWSEMTKYCTEMLLNLDSKASDLVAVKDLDSQREKLEHRRHYKQGTFSAVQDGQHHQVQRQGLDDLWRNGPLVDRGR